MPQAWKYTPMFEQIVINEQLYKKTSIRMIIKNLTKNSKMYTSNVFLVLGSWKTIDNVNTLIDVGRDESIIKQIGNINTGSGKKMIDQVILTHNHSDLAWLLPKIKEIFNPKIYAFNSHLKSIDQTLKDGDKLRLGEKQFEVFHYLYK